MTAGVTVVDVVWYRPREGVAAALCRLDGAGPTKWEFRGEGDATKRGCLRLRERMIAS